MSISKTLAKNLSSVARSNLSPGCSRIVDPKQYAICYKIDLRNVPCDKLVGSSVDIPVGWYSYIASEFKNLSINQIIKLWYVFIHRYHDTSQPTLYRTAATAYNTVYRSAGYKLLNVRIGNPYGVAEYLGKGMYFDTFLHPKMMMFVRCYVNRTTPKSTLESGNIGLLLPKEFVIKLSSRFFADTKNSLYKETINNIIPYYINLKEVYLPRYTYLNSYAAGDMKVPVTMEANDDWVKMFHRVNYPSITDDSDSINKFIKDNLLSKILEDVKTYTL